MKHILAITLITFCLISYYLVFFEGKAPHSVNQIDFGCGKVQILTINNAKPKKHIYLVEGLVKGHPHLSCRMWDTYDRVARLALKVFEKQDPTYQPVIHFINSQSENVDPMRPASIVAEVAVTDALAVVGFAWSTMAGVAAEQADRMKIPYIAPTAVLKTVFEGKYSVSIGTPLEEAARGFERLVANLENPKIVIAEATDQIQEREYADAVRKRFPEAISLQYQESFPTERIVAELAKLQDSNHLLFVPGYTTVKQGVEDVLSLFPETTIVVGPQWSHDHRLLDFDGKIYCVSDYFNLIQNEVHDGITQAWIDDGGEIIGGYLYSLYDAVMFTLKALDSEKIQTRSDLVLKMKNIGFFEGAKGRLAIENGNVRKTIYILKHEKRQGFTLVEEV